MVATDALAILQRVPLFRQMPSVYLRHIARVAIRRSFSAGELLCSKGDVGTTMFVLVKGQAEVVGIDEEGREVLLAILNEGDVFGELSLIDGQGRSADVVALSDGELLIVRRSDFLPLAERMPQLMWELLLTVTKRLRETDELVLRMAWLNAQQRVAWALLEYAKEGKLPKWLTVHMLAKRCGLARETASRIVSQWQRSGVLRRSKEGWEVAKPEILRAILKEAVPIGQERSVL
ncbi:MAG: Crp/Fnr family transcriptional regulator [Armatimonadota bacterium]|jgi:CRP/FNR family transcriptional regulator/CRP/FNR family cyclic AMP-dependent transcriptional regulator|nr:Crp/Fnr family transcriptional regulator [Armatimonadota bacterium]MDT7973356.1 Crp/Fnr family transcriptional regulator [Armatimonadota bacterium]